MLLLLLLLLLVNALSKYQIFITIRQIKGKTIIDKLPFT